MLIKKTANTVYQVPQMLLYSTNDTLTAPSNTYGPIYLLDSIEQVNQFKMIPTDLAVSLSLQAPLVNSLPIPQQQMKASMKSSVNSMSSSSRSVKISKKTSYQMELILEEWSIGQAVEQTVMVEPIDEEQLRGMLDGVQRYESNREEVEESRVQDIHKRFMTEEKRQNRRQKVEKYRAKRNLRIWKKKIYYQCRKKFADKRVRVKGRFITKVEEEVLMTIPQLPKEKSYSEENTTHQMSA